MAPTKPTINTDQIVASAVAATLQTLRDQRDDKQQVLKTGTYEVNPQIFAGGTHYVTNPISFGVSFMQAPVIVFGGSTEKAVENISGSDLGISGYRPLVLHSYVYGYDQSSGYINGFYLGLYALTPVPVSSSRYIVSWSASGLASNYPQQRIDEAWTSAYNSNEADYLVNDTTTMDDDSVGTDDQN